MHETENAAIAAAQNEENKRAAARAAALTGLALRTLAWNEGHPESGITLSPRHAGIAWTADTSGPGAAYLRHVDAAVRPHAAAAGLRVELVHKAGLLELSVGRGGGDPVRAGELLLLAAKYVAKDGGGVPQGALPRLSPCAERMIEIHRAARAAGFRDDTDLGFDTVGRGTPAAYVWRRVWHVAADWEVGISLAVRISDGAIVRSVVETVDRRPQGTGRVRRESTEEVDLPALLETLAFAPRGAP